MLGNRHRTQSMTDIVELGDGAPSRLGAQMGVGRFV
jgi:hypothetical protein